MKGILWTRDLDRRTAYIPCRVPSSAIAGVANGSRQAAAAERSATRTYLMS